MLVAVRRLCETKQDALDRANSVMGTSLTRDDVNVRVVRDVAPKKPMLCLSFRAPDASTASPTPTSSGAPGVAVASATVPSKTAGSSSTATTAAPPEATVQTAEPAGGAEAPPTTAAGLEVATAVEGVDRGDIFKRQKT